MRPDMDHSRQANSSSFRITFRTALKVLCICLLSASVPAAVYVRVASKNSASASNNSPVKSSDSTGSRILKGEVTVHAAGRGKPFINLHDGRSVSLSYRGNQAGSLQDGSARARSLASADFDSNGTPDLVAGYASNGSGLITIQRGNPDAFAPAEESVYSRMQAGYNPDSLLPNAEVYPVPASPDFLFTGDFTGDGQNDVLFAAKGGALYVMPNDGRGGFGELQKIALPGNVTALAAGEFRAADGRTDVAVAVSSSVGNSLLLLDGAEGLSNTLAEVSLSEPASAIEFGGLDDDPFQDVAVAAGSEIVVVHGWGRKENVTASSRIEHVKVGSELRGLVVGEFAWDRQGRSEIAGLTDDGMVHIVQNAKLDTRPFTEEEAALRTRGNSRPQGSILKDVETVPSWQRGKATGWAESKSFTATSFTGVSSTSVRPLMRTNLGYRETDDLLLLGESQAKLEIVHPIGPMDRAVSAALETRDDLLRTTLDVESAPVAVLLLPKKINGESEVVVLNSTSSAPSLIADAPNTTITVDRTDDPSGAGLTAASACTAAGNDCSLRGAIQFANLPANNNTTISLPANTYILSINGTGAGGCDGNTVGDLGANQTMSITGAGSATTIIRQTGTGPASDGDRVMCMDEPFTQNLIYNFSGFTMVGGRDGTAAGTGTALGGGGIIGGEKGNVLTLTNVVLANNQVTVLGSANIGGGGIQWTGGSLNITNCTMGGTNAPGAYTDRTSTNTGNLQGGSGGGVMYTPAAPQHSAATGILTVSGSTFSHNTVGSIGSGGGGVDLVNFAFAAPGSFGSGSVTIGTSTFSNNLANPGNGAGILVESLPTTVATTSITNNSAGNLGGGIYVGGGSLTLNGTTPSITFTGNTATNGGSGIGVNVGIDQDPATSVRTINATGGVQLQGTNTNLSGHDVYLATNGAWTNQAGSSLTIGNLIQDSGGSTCAPCNPLFAEFKANNTTTTITGNWTLLGGTFVGDTGTVNLAGNFSFNQSAGAGAITAGSSTVNFNGSGAQSITNGTSITFFNLTDSNITQPLTLNNSLAVNGNLNVNGANAILSPVAAAVISGTGTLTGTGTARVSRIAATPDFLTQYSITNKTLTNLTINYNGAGNQTVNNTPTYSKLIISGSGTKTLQGNTAINSDLTINAGVFASGNFNFNLKGSWTNNVGAGGFTPGTGTVTFDGSGVGQTITGTTTFFNLTLNNNTALTDFGSSTTTIANNFVTTAGTMQGNTSTIIFTGAAGSISGAQAKQFNNLQINAGASITNSTGGNTTILNDYTNNGVFTQAAGLSTTFVNGADGIHSMTGSGASTFGLFGINGGNTVNAAHGFSVVGASFTATGAFSASSGTVLFNGAVPQQIIGDGSKSFVGLTSNNATGVTLTNGTGAVDALVSGLLTLTTDLTVAGGAILQQSGTSAGTADVVGTVRRTDLGGVERSFGNVNNSITINTGTAPTQMDFNLLKAAPVTFPPAVKVVPRDITLTPTGGSGISATVKLRYIDPAELAGPAITESRLILWKNIASVWTPQGGTPNTASDFVSLSGVSTFSEWAIAESSDLTITKANNVSNAAITGQPWNWTLTATNSGAPATFTSGQTILSDNLPNSNVNYGTPTVQNATNITGSANISCSIVSNDLTCTASGGSVTFDSNIGASSFQVVFSATPQAVGTFQNPRAGGNVQIDPNGVIVESNEGNNTATANTVTVSKANTTTAITNDLSAASLVGQSVTVQWSVNVTAPGTVGVPLTGNVTISDGTASCFADVSAGQCNITFTSPGAKSLTATYAGDTNYNGSASTPATPHTVNKADTTTTITSDNPDPSTPGQSVTVQWTVTVNAPGAGTPTGLVTVTVSGGAETCNAAVATGQCSLIVNGGGPRTITATYAGDTNFNTSSDTESHQVCTSSLVTSTADSGAGSLRDVVANACDGATVTFDSAGVFATPQTITLTTGEILIDKNLTISGGISKVTISGNNASRAFHINTGRTVAIIGLTISGGNSTTNGGGVFNEGALSVVDSTLTGNIATTDGGAIHQVAAGASLVLINTTVSGNNANENAGGVDVLGGSASIINSTITNNRADADAAGNSGVGGGLRTGGNVILSNSIIAGNFIEAGASDTPSDISGPVDGSSSSNLVGVDTGITSGITNGTNGNQVGTGAAPINPQLGALTNNGGTTSTHALLPSSTAIDAGSAANLPTDTFDLDGDANTGEPLPVDQRGPGFPRQIGSNVDIGALELGQADLSITKTDGSAAEIPGTSVTYTIVVSNAGPGPANGATVSDTFPAALTGITYTSVAAGGATGNTAAGAGNINDTVNLPSGSSVTYTVNATIQSSATGSLSNTATVTAPSTVVDPAPLNNTATDTDSLTPQADLAITKTDGVVTAIPGGSVTYTITVTNSGPSDANGATAADTFPAALTGVTFTSVTAGGASGNTAAGSGNISDALNMPSGSSVTYTVNANILASATGTLSNTATITAPGGVPDPTPGNNTASDTDTLTPQADLSITKTDGSTTATPGGSVTYTIVVTNNGPSIANGTQVSDTFPAALTGVTFTSVAAGGATGNTAAGSGNISDTLNMPSGSSVTYTVHATVQTSATGTLSNTATVTAPAGVTDPTPGNNSATDSDTLVTSADVSVTNTDSPDPVQSASNITYTIVVTNNGPSDAQSLSFSDVVPANTTLVSVTTPSGWVRTDAVPAGGTGTITFTRTTQPASAASTFTLVVNVNAAAASGTVITDTATVSTSTTDPTPGNNSATTTTLVQNEANVNIQDAQAVEPASGSTNMIFAVTLTAPAPVGGASVNFTTQDQAPAPGHAVAGQDYTATSGNLNFAAGEQFKTIAVPILSDVNNTEVNETFLVVLSNPVNALIIDGTATGTILTANTAGTFLISELRTSGPAGAGDDFVELYNNTDSPLTVTASDASGGYGLFKMGADCSATPVLIATIPNGTIIPARGHYLVVGSAYSLANYGGTSAAAGDLTMSSDIENDRNVGIFSTASLPNISSATRLDAVGFGSNTGGICDLLSEGTTLTPLVGSVLEYSYVRDECGKKGNPAIFGACSVDSLKDSNVNSDDFIFIDTAATVTVAGQRLGAPGPQNLSSPTKNNNVGTALLDANVGGPTAPNRVRDLTPGVNAANGTMSIRRRFVNNTGDPVTRLRFRIVDISSISVPGGIADLRALTSLSVSANGITDSATCLASTGNPATPCTVTVLGTTLETPPAQAIGGALNSTMSATTVTLGTPLAPGASINLQFLLGVQQTGSFKFYINLEALPSTSSSPIPALPHPSKSNKIRVR